MTPDIYEQAARRALLADLRCQLRIARVRYGETVQPREKRGWGVDVASLQARVRALEGESRG